MKPFQIQVLVQIYGYRIQSKLPLIYVGFKVKNIGSQALKDASPVIVGLLPG